MVGFKFTMHGFQSQRVAKKAQTAPVKFKKVGFELNWQTYAATTGASQPSAFNFLRYALIFRSLLN